MGYTFPATQSTDLAFSLGWIPSVYWATELAWKSNVYEYPKVTARKYKEALGLENNAEASRAIDALDEVTLGDHYILNRLSAIPIEERGALFIEEIEQSAEEYIWNHWTSCLREHMYRAVTFFMNDFSRNYGPCDEDVPNSIENLVNEFVIGEHAARITVPNTYILIEANDRGITTSNDCTAVSIDEALIAFEYGPGGLENHWENMIDQEIVSGDEDFNPEHPAFKDRALHTARCFFGLEDGEDPEQHGNYIDGDSNSAFKLIEITSSGEVNSYPE